MELTRSRLQRSCPKRTVSVLRYLGISVPCDGKGNGFWLRNEHQLEELYLEFQIRRRQRLAELHPDKGGDVKAYTSLNAACQMVERQFQRRLGNHPISLAVIKPRLANGEHFWVEINKIASQIDRARGECPWTPTKHLKFPPPGTYGPDREKPLKLKQ